jgi:glycosyltransferase involved in cell wall biosynthesis
MVSGNAPPVMDGVGDCTARLLEELVRQRPGFRWVWLCKRPRWFHAPVTSQSGATLLRPSHSWSPTGRAIVAATVRALRPDLVHVQDQIHSFYETDAAVRVAGAAAGVAAPVVTTLHEYHVERPSVRHTTELVRRSAFVIANDPRNAERCLSEAGREPDVTWWSGSTVLPPAGDPSATPVPRTGVVATFGFLNGLKALDVAAEALRRVRAAHPGLLWRVIGPFDPENDPRHAELVRLVGSEGVEFTGGFSVDDPRLRALLSEAQVMLLPFTDGASERRTSLHAAWAYGIPVVTTPPPTAATSIVDGENCLLVRESTPEAWASAVGRALTDDALADRLRAGGLALADRFSWRRLAEAHLAVYDGLLQGKTAPREPAPALGR